MASRGTARTAAQANTWTFVTYGNGLFVAVSGDGTNRVMTSPAANLDLFFTGTTIQTISGNLGFVATSTIPNMTFSGSGCEDFHYECYYH